MGAFTLSFLLELLLAKPVDDDVDADVDRGADDEEQKPHVDQLERGIIMKASKTFQVQNQRRFFFENKTHHHMPSQNDHQDPA